MAKKMTRKVARKNTLARPNGPDDKAGGKAGRGAASADAELLTMDQAVEILKTTRPTFYRWVRSGKVRGMKVGRQWRFDRREIDRFLRGQEPRIEVRGDIKSLLATLRRKVEELGVRDFKLSAETEVQEAVKLMMRIGAGLGASDLHLSTHLTGQGDQKAGFLRYRIDGVLHTLARIDARLMPALSEQWKLYGAVDPHARRPQDARIVVEALGVAEPLDMRVCYLPAGLGDSLTVRFLVKDNVPLGLDSMDFSASDRERLLRNLEAPWGLILATGPTGSGKTTLTYACLNHVNRPELKVVTIEDPIEYYFPWMVQTQVNEPEGMTFARAGRAALRSDPDVIMIGELRNSEVAMLSLQMSLTGHLVFSQLHADDAPRALVRMVEMGCPPFVVADATRLVVSQRLVRVLCPDCSEPTELPARHLARAIEIARSGGLDFDSLEKNFRKPVGCDKCKRIGYRGRTLIAETLEVTPRIGEALRCGASVGELRAIAVDEGMTTMGADGIRRAAAGRTTIDEVLGVLPISDRQG